MDAYKIQNIADITASELPKKAAELKGEGYRLGQICGTRMPDGTELLYSFDKDHMLMNLRVIVNDGDEVNSITETYWPAFIYENEVHDLFGVKFLESKLDYEGRFFRLAMPTPWKTVKKGAE